MPGFLPVSMQLPASSCSDHRQILVLMRARWEHMGLVRYPYESVLTNWPTLMKNALYIFTILFAFSGVGIHAEEKHKITMHKQAGCMCCEKHGRTYFLKLV